jgi:hypothetical protein
MIYKKTLHGSEALKILNFLNIPLKLKDLEIEIIIKPKEKIDFSKYKIASFNQINPLEFQKSLRDEFVN